MDLSALANHRIEVGVLEARLRNGTLISIPGDARFSECDLRAAFAKEGALTVSLGLPLLQIARANITAGSQAKKTRYVVDELSFEDENTGLNPQRIQVRLLNVQLLTSSQDATGYETLPLAAVQRSRIAPRPLRNLTKPTSRPSWPAMPGNR